MRQFLEQVFSDERVSRLFYEAPGGKSYHHSRLGGLICHTVSVAENCLKLAAGQDVDADILVAGALLHDIGKIEAYDWSGAAFEMTDRSRLLGHIALGLMLLNGLLLSSPEGLSEDRIAELLHMVLSHHGSKDKGSPVELLTLEAEILHYADEFDFKADRIGRAKEEAGEGSRWTEKIHVLGRSYYLGSRLAGGTPEERKEETAVAEDQDEIWEEDS